MIDTGTQYKLQHLQEGAGAYLNALQLNSAMSSLHYDLGVNYYFQALHGPDTKRDEMLQQVAGMSHWPYYH